MTNKIPAVGYVRCSTEMQEDSPEQQKKEIEAFAIIHGYEVGEWFVDFGKSGTTFDQRSEFQRLRHATENHPTFKAVICYDESRWGRAIDAEENTFWRVHFRRCGVDVVLVKTSIDPKHEFAPMLKAFEGVQASQYSKKLSELTLRGALNNGRFSSGGTAPYGYSRAAINTKTQVTRILKDGEWCTSGQEKVFWVPGEKDEIGTIRIIFNLRIKGMSCALIAELLNSRGIACPRRGRWRNKDQKWSSITIKSIIESPAYYGARAYNRNSMSKIRAEKEGWEIKKDITFPHWRLDKESWTIFEDAHEPLVSKEEWKAANAIRKRPVNSGRIKHKTPYLLSSLLICGKCGFHFQGQTTGVKGKYYHRYICGGYNAKRVCDYVVIKRDQLEHFVLGCVRETLQTEEMASDVERKLRQLLDLEPGNEKMESDRLSKEMQTLQSKLDRILVAIEDGTSAHLFGDRIVTIEKEKKRIQEEIEKSLHTETVSLQIDDVAGMVREFATHFEEIFESAPLAERKDLLRRCVSRIIVEHEPKVVRCFVRKIPVVNDQIAGILESVQKGYKTLMATESSPLVITGVAGTRYSVHLHLPYLK